MEDNRAAVLAAMYQDEAGESPDGSNPHTVLTSQTRTRKIRVGIIEYEVPSVEYVQQLENTVARQGRLIEQNQRLIDRLVAGLARVRHAQQNHTGTIDEMRAELAKKISQRDFS